MKIPFSPTLVPEFLHAVVSSLPEKSLINVRRRTEKSVVDAASKVATAPAKASEIKLKRVCFDTTKHPISVSTDLTPAEGESLVDALIIGSDVAQLKKLDAHVFEVLAGLKTNGTKSGAHVLPVELTCASAAEVAAFFSGLSKEVIQDAKVSLGLHGIGNLNLVGNEVIVKGSIIVDSQISLEVSGPAIPALVKAIISKVPKAQIKKLDTALMDLLLA